MALDLKAKTRYAIHSAVTALRDFAYAWPLSRRREKPAAARRRVGVALGGGFARGLAHLGVLKVLVENRIPIDALSGTSVGSVVAAAFAAGSSVEEMVEAGRKIRWKSFGRWTIPRLGFATNTRMEEWLRSVLPCLTFEELKIPLAIVAADIATGEPVVFCHGDLIPPLRASCSFPGLFTPVEYQGRMLVDGAIVGSVPVAPLRDFGVDVVVAVYLKTNGPRHAPRNLFQVVGQAFQIVQSLNQATWREDCDLVIEPEAGDFMWDEFERADELVAAGERAALQALPRLRALLEPSLAEAAARPVLVR